MRCLHHFYGLGLHIFLSILAKKWTNEESNAEINELNQEFSTMGKFDGDLILLECSKKYANLVRKNGGDISYNIIDECVYADCECED